MSEHLSIVTCVESDVNELRQSETEVLDRNSRSFYKCKSLELGGDRTAYKSSFSRNYC